MKNAMVGIAAVTGAIAVVTIIVNASVGPAFGGTTLLDQIIANLWLAASLLFLLGVLMLVFIPKSCERKPPW